MRRALAILAVFVIILPAALAPRPAHAQWAVFDASNFVKNTITSVMTSDLFGTSQGMWVKEYLLDPIAWSLAQQSLQSMTGSIVNFVNGQGNGTNASQFVQNLPLYMRNVGDNEAMSFFAQFSSNSNSPFAASIASSLRTNYLQETSGSGFFATNQCTLSNYSPDPKAFMQGDWSQGGIAEWFALTTNNANNPYTLKEAATNQLNARLSTQQNAVKSELNWGQGILGWCGNGTTAISGAAPVPCLNADGSSGTIQTPGAVIMASLNHGLQLGENKLVAADEISEMIGSIAANLATNALGGASGGLSGLSQSSNGTTYTSALRGSTVTGSSAPTVNAATLAKQVLDNITTWNSIWNAIIAAANQASTAEQNLIKNCPSGAGGAQTTITNDINPVISNAQQKLAEVQSTYSFALKVQQEAGSSATQQVLADSQTLITMTPTAADVAIAQANQPTTINSMNAIVSSANSTYNSFTCSMNGLP